MSRCEGCGAVLVWAQGEDGRPLKVAAAPGGKRLVLEGRPGREPLARSVNTYLPHERCPRAAPRRARRRSPRGRRSS